MAHYRCPAGCRGHYAEPGTCQEASRRARILSNVPVRIPSTMIALKSFLVSLLVFAGLVHPAPRPSPIPSPTLVFSTTPTPSETSSTLPTETIMPTTTPVPSRSPAPISSQLPKRHSSPSPSPSAQVISMAPITNPGSVPSDSPAPPPSRPSPTPDYSWDVPTRDVVRRELGYYDQIIKGMNGLVSTIDSYLSRVQRMRNTIMPAYIQMAGWPASVQTQFQSLLDARIMKWTAIQDHAQSDARQFQNARDTDYANLIINRTAPYMMITFG